MESANGVVQKLLDRDYHVRALVRDLDRAKSNLARRDRVILGQI